MVITRNCVIVVGQRRNSMTVKIWAGAIVAAVLFAIPSLFVYGFTGSIACALAMYTFLLVLPSAISEGISMERRNRKNNEI